MSIRRLAIAISLLSLSALALPGDDGDLSLETFVLAIDGGAITWDPHHAYSADEAQIFTALHEGLYVYDPVTLEPTLALAEKMVRSRDKKTYTFTIREGARFSNGDPVLAEHVRATWMRMLGPAEGAEYSSLFDCIKGAADYRQGKAKDGASVGIYSSAPRTLVVELENPAAYFTKLLCHHSFAVLHPSMLSADAWLKPESAAVSGPFRFQAVKADEVLLTKNERYWDAANVALPGIRVIVSNDDAEMTRRYNSGEIHWLAGPLDADLLLDAASIQVTRPLFSTHYMFFNCAQKPFSDARVRRALDLLIPWNLIRNQDRYYEPADSLVSELQNYPRVTAAHKTDREAAMKLLAEAGFPEGAGLPEIVVKLSDSADQNDLGNTLVEAFTEAGLAARLLSVDPYEYYDSLDAKDYTIASMTWIGDFADPLTFLQMWTSGSGLNDPGFKDADFDRLVAKSMSEEGVARYQTMSKAEGILLSSAACMPVYHSIAVNIISTDSVAGWASNPLDMHPFKFLKLTSAPAVQGVVNIGRRALLASLGN